MRTIGLIGGMSFESTAIYYRLINDGVRTPVCSRRPHMTILGRARTRPPR